MAAPSEEVWSGPRAVYEAIVVRPVSPTMVAVIVAVIAAVRATGAEDRAAPEAPPPKVPWLPDFSVT